jgi:hypothetical protein
MGYVTELEAREAGQIVYLYPQRLPGVVPLS